MAYYLKAPDGRELAYSSKDAAIAAMRRALKKYPDWKQADFVLEYDDAGADAPPVAERVSAKPYAPPKGLVAQNRKENIQAEYPTLSRLFPRVVDKVSAAQADKVTPSLSDIMLGVAGDALTQSPRGLRGAANAALGFVPYLNLGGIEDAANSIASYGSDSFGDMMTSPGAALTYMTAPVSAPAAIGSRVAALPSALRVAAGVGGSAARGGTEAVGSALVDNALDGMDYDASGQGLWGGLMGGGLSAAGRAIGAASKGNLFKKAIQGNKTVQQNVAEAAKLSGTSERDYVSRLVTEGYLTPSGSWNEASNKIRDDIVKRSDNISAVLQGETAQLPKEALVRAAERGVGELLTGGKILGDQFDEVLGIIPGIVDNKVYKTVREKNVIDALDGDMDKFKAFQDVMQGRNPSVDDATAAAAKEFVESKYLPRPYDLWRARQTLGQKTDFKGLKRAAMSNAPYENTHLAQSVVYDAINRAMKDNLAAPPLMGALPGPNGTSGRFMSHKASQALTDYDRFVRSHLPMEELADHAAARYERNNAIGLNTMIPAAASIGGSLSSGGDVLSALYKAAPIAGISYLANKAPSPPVLGILMDDFLRNSKKSPIAKAAGRRASVSVATSQRDPRQASLLVKGGAQGVTIPQPTYRAASVADLR